MNTFFQPADLSELREKLELLGRADQLSVDQVLACMHDTMELAQQVASSLEEAGQRAAAAAVYEDAAVAFQEASQRMTEKGRELVAPLVDYWLYTARLKRDLALAETKSEKREESPPSRPERTVTVQRPWRPEELTERVKTLWDQGKGVITARDISDISLGEEEMAFRKPQVIKKRKIGRWGVPQREDTLFKK